MEKSKVVLANSKDPRYLDLKKIVDSVDTWQTLDFESITASKEKMKKIGWRDTIYPISFSTTTFENKTYSYSRLNLNVDEMITQLIKRYEGGKIFVWAKNMETRIFKILIRNCKNGDKKRILRIMMYNIVDLQSLFEGADPLILINDQVKSAALDNWSKFFGFVDTPIESKEISFAGYNLKEKQKENMRQTGEIDITTQSKVDKYLKKVVKHNELDTKTIYNVFKMIKNDKKKMVFLNELENQSLEI